MTTKTIDPFASAFEAYSAGKLVIAPQTLNSPMNLRSFCKRTGTALLALTCGVGIYASSTTKAVADTQFLDFTGMSAADTLQMTYLILTPSAHKFGGYRMAAIKDLRAAGTLVGLKLKGDGTGAELVNRSVLRLKMAQAMLVQLRSRLTQPNQQVLAAYIDDAARQLGAALAIHGN
jgi:hypothetical protein